MGAEHPAWLLLYGVLRARPLIETPRLQRRELPFTMVDNNDPLPNVVCNASLVIPPDPTAIALATIVVSLG